MSTDEYVPSEEDAVDNYVSGRGGDDPGLSLAELRAEYGPEFDRFLARVRRDAARAALIEFRRTELALIPPDADEDDPVRTRQQALAWRIEMHLLGNYPEETP